MHKEMEWKRLPDGRSILPTGTILRFWQEGGYYRILGKPVGYGGSGILYPAVRLIKGENGWEEDEMQVAVKECFPVVRGAALVRKDSGEILGQENASYRYARQMLKKERSVTAQIYNKGFRVVPLWDVVEKEQISLDGEHFEEAGNLYGVMERLDEKGISLGTVLRDKEKAAHFNAYTCVILIGQVLRALKEVHENGFLHGDIQENNIFIKGGDLERPEQGAVSLIDLGAARPLLEDGATEAIADRSLYTTNGYTAPECIRGNDGTLRLTRAADLYSVGYLLLRMLTGRATDPRVLELVVNGKYLYGRQARKIGCPSSALGAVNKILQNALQPDPADRYQTAEEMLEEIGRLERALAPRNSAIAAVDYAAFISYCHEEKSMGAAEQIQKMIESYKIPRPVRRKDGRSRLGKVFRDREELSSSSDMGSHLKEALAHSEFLIVLLSPGTPESVWVNREIQTFLETHSREHVLTVLVEGEPEDTLPDLLLRDEKGSEGGIRLQPVEGLAADIRGAGKREQKKKLKTEIYRLLAPMLGCAYDDLRQRQREYHFQKVVRTMTAAMLFLSVIAGYIGWQAYQIHQNYWETLIQRSRYLAQVSGDLLAKGDRLKAIAVAMEALPHGEDDRSKPYVGEAEAALSQALYSYRAMRSRAYFLNGDRLLSMDAGARGMEAISPDGKWLLAVDEADTVYLWDIDSGSCERKWDAAFWQEQQIAGRICYCGFSDEETLLLLTEELMASIDINEQRVEKLRDLEYGKDYQSTGMVCGVSGDGALLAVYRDHFTLRESLQDRSLAVYRRTDGEMICSVPAHTVMEEWEWSHSAGDLAFSQDGCYLALPVYITYGVVAKEGDILGALLLTDLKDGSYELIEDRENGYHKALFLEDGNVAAFGYRDDVPSDNYEVTMSGAVGCYDPETGRKIWEVQILCQKWSGQASGLQSRTMQIEGEEREILILWCGRDIWFFDASTGREIWQYSCEKSLVGMQPWQDELLMGMEDGSLSLLYPEKQKVLSLGTNVERRTDRILYDERSQTACLVTMEDGGGKIALLKMIGDKDREAIKMKGQMYFLFMYPQKALYAAYTKDEEGRSEITFYEEAAHKEKASVQIEGVVTEGCWLEGEGERFCYIEEHIGGEWRRNRIVAYDVAEQAVCWQVEIEDSIQDRMFSIDGEDSIAVLDLHSRVEVVDLQDGKRQESIDVEKKEEDWSQSRRVREVKVSPSGRYILLITEGMTGGRQSNGILQILDRKEGREIRLPEEIAGMGPAPAHGDALYTAQEKDLVAIYREEEGQLSILDLEKLDIVQRIPVYAVDHRQIAFLPDDRQILLWENDMRLKLWDIENARIKMEDTQKLYQVDRIYIEKGSPFIEIRGVDEAHQSFSRGHTNGDRLLYRLEESGRFYPYAYLLEGSYVPGADKVICFGPEGREMYWYDRYTLDELLEKAREVLDGYTLDRADKIRYFLEE